MPESSSLASCTRALRKHLNTLGLDSDRLCREAGLDPQQLDSPEGCCRVATHSRLWELAAHASGDPAIGLRVSRLVTPSSFPALGYGVVASDNLREVFERIVRYHTAVSDALQPQLHYEDGRYRLRLHPLTGHPPCAAEAIDAFSAIYLRICRQRLGRDYAPLAVRLTRPAPLDPEPWHRIIRAPVEFAALENALEFAGEDLESHLDEPTPEMAKHHEAVLDRTLGLMRPLTWERRVRHAIEHTLPNGEPDAERIAKALHQSPLNLQRNLANEGCRYDILLDECRQNLALAYLRDADATLEEVASRLGFADTASFRRAFKRWTGLSPGQYRLGL
jgi:AraC-like DNA-binding protein